MFKPGQKVICIRAGANEAWPWYQSPLIDGNVYVVRGTVMTPIGKIGIQLIGLEPHQDFNQQSFCATRFKLLEEMKMEVKQQRVLTEAI